MTNDQRRTLLFDFGEWIAVHAPANSVSVHLTVAIEFEAMLNENQRLSEQLADDILDGVELERAETEVPYVPTPEDIKELNAMDLDATEFQIDPPDTDHLGLWEEDVN